jgi:uncharacterized protein (DUF2384 family)
MSRRLLIGCPPPLALFNNQTPTELLGTSEGIELVERTLTRIEHNIPS